MRKMYKRKRRSCGFNISVRSKIIAYGGKSL